MRTWKAQKDYEHKIRKAWLQEVASMDASIQQMADAIGMERGQFHKTCKKYGVEIVTNKQRQARAESKRQAEIKRNAEAKKAEAQRQSIIDRTRETAARELNRRKALLMAEGFTEQQALRALAHQLGVAQEAAQ